MEKQIVKVFVYGTLRKGESNHKVAAPHIISQEPGTVKGRLYSVHGMFPAIVLDKENGQDIVGEWFTVSETGLAPMDRLEGYKGEGENNYYDRIVVTDSKKNIEGYIYIYTDEKVQSGGLKRMESGDWMEISER